MSTFINALLFQAGWWFCVAGVGHGLELEAMGVCLILTVTQLRMSRSFWPEARLGTFALLTGIVVDSLLQNLSVIDFYGWALGPLSPFWLWLLWFMFGLTLNASLAWLKAQSLSTLALIGLIMGPLTYYGGARMGAASLDATPAHIATLALAWMVALPLLVVVAKRTASFSKA